MKPLVIAILYVLFLVPSLWSLGAVLDLVLNIGKSTSNYAGYGLAAGETLTAYAVLSVIVLWLCLGTVLTVLIFRKRIRSYWMWALPAIGSFVIFPATVVFLLGAGHF